MKTLVTGGAGFIGSNLVRKLLDEGRDIIIADDYSSGSFQNLANLDVKPKDIEYDLATSINDLRDYGTVTKLVRKVDTVFHLAARIGNITYLHGNDNNELQALMTNLTIDANVFRACMENGVKKLIFASSAAVYPVNIQNMSYEVVLSEDMLTSHDPDGGYGWAKLMGETELQWMKGMGIGIARIFNVYGRNSKTDSQSHVVIDLMKKVLMYPREPFIIWGDGRQSRDFLYVSDCVDSLIKLEEKSTCPPVVVNVGSGEATTISTLAEKIVQTSGKKVQITYDSSKLVGPLSRTADLKKTKAILDWNPKIDLDEGLARTYDWLKKKSTSYS